MARLEGRWSVERTVEEAYRALAYNEKSAPRLLALGERTAKSSRNPYLLIERRKRKLLLAWKMIGHAQVTVTYANEKPEVITTRLPENAAKWKELTAYFPGLPQSERLTPEIIWNYGIGALAEGDRLRTTDDNFFSSSGGFSGYGTHTIKDLKGNVIATLEVKPVK